MLLTVFVLLILSDCTSQRYFIKNFQQQYYNIDSNIPYQNLKIIELFTLEENSKFNLKSVNSIDIDSSGKKLLLADESNAILYLYDYNSGNIIDFVKAELYLSDSIALSGYEPHNFIGKKYKWLLLKEYKDYGIDPNSKFGGYNYFSHPKFTDENKIIALSIIYTAAVAKDNFKTKFNNTAIAIFDDSLTLQKLIVLENNDSSHALPYGFIFNAEEEKYKVTSMGLVFSNNDSLDYNITTLSEYDNYGKFQQISSTLPKIHQLGYHKKDGMNPPYIVQTISNNFLTYWSGVAMYDMKGNKKFDFYNLPFSNEPGLKYYRSIAKELYYERMNYSEERRIIQTLFPIMVKSCFAINENIAVQFLVYDTLNQNGYYYILQEYDSLGQLISQTRIEDNPKKPIRLMRYDNLNNLLLFFREGKQNWFLEKRKWINFK